LVEKKEVWRKKAHDMEFLRTNIRKEIKEEK
jgi:hypothetical protein